MILRRNPDYWAQNLPVQRGLFNFDEIEIDYYRDADLSFEAFKAWDSAIFARRPTLGVG